MVDVFRALLALVLIATVFGLSGCSRQASDHPLPSIESNLQAIHVFMGRAAGQNRGRSPANEAAFRAYLGSLPAEELSLMKIESIDALLKSPRDQQPLVINYGQPAGMPGVGSTGILAHEKTGVDGKRFVLLATGDRQEVDETRFQELGGAK